MCYPRNSLASTARPQPKPMHCVRSVIACGNVVVHVHMSMTSHLQSECFITRQHHADGRKELGPVPLLERIVAHRSDDWKQSPVLVNSGSEFGDEFAGRQTPFHPGDGLVIPAATNSGARRELRLSVPGTGRPVRRLSS